MPAGLSSWAEIHAWRPNVVQIQLKKTDEKLYGWKLKFGKRVSQQISDYM